LLIVGIPANVRCTRSIYCGGT